MSNLTPHQKWVLQKRKCSMKRLKYEYKTNILPYIHVCMKWTLKNYRLAATGLCGFIIFVFTMTYLYSTPRIELNANPTLSDLHKTGSVVVFEGSDLNGEQLVLQPGIYWTGLFCHKNSKTNFRTWQIRQPSNDWVKQEYPSLSKETETSNSHNSPIFWDEPINFCPLSMYIPKGYVVEILGSNGISSSKATCQVPMRKHAIVFKTKRYSIQNNHRNNDLHFISENVRNTACHLLVVRKLNEIATFYEFKHHKGRRFSIDFPTFKKKLYPIVIWTGLHCTSSMMPTNLYVNKLLSLTNSSSNPVKINYAAPLSFLPRSVNIVEAGYSIYYVYIKERGGCSPASLNRWYYKGPIASTSKYDVESDSNALDKTIWNDVASSNDLIHLVVITKDKKDER